MISRACLVNKLREIGYVFVMRTKRTELYRKKGGMHRIPLTTHSFFAEAYVFSVLTQCGLPRDEILSFIRAAAT